MKHISNIKLIALGALFSTSLFAKDLPQKYQMTAEFAEQVAKDAISQCLDSQVNISASVVNDQGRLVYFYRGNNTGANTIHTSFRKAYTSASLKIPTSQLVMAVEAKGYSQLGKMEDDILLLTGGLPIYYKKTLIGAIGLSGAPNPLIEEECGKNAIAKVLGEKG
ncbi:hypothetical protein OA92_13190 [Marinomonas sp. SBI22]|uniref:GlcG/HbpS family heme-binding protein n=1 Tax=unclassified Marinomonas TaxID=196814 RepID=UPI0007AEEC67|nr:MULTISPECIES: heme-binding protein [unclassified Marinomonas]KZM42153.1 hypothetical protein OA92_13190 [Marinomonas sp. SBI22]KZM47003.1 hypothetical protein OA91_00215 [Marinomonas sp. SBI8L]